MKEIVFSHQSEGYNIEQVNSYISLLQDEYEKLFEHCNELLLKINEINLSSARSEVKFQAELDDVKTKNTLLQQKVDSLTSASSLIKEDATFTQEEQTENSSSNKLISANGIGGGNDEIILKTVASLTGIVEKLINDKL